MAFPLERCGHSRINSQTIKYHCTTKASNKQNKHIANHTNSEKPARRRPANHISVSDSVYFFSSRNKKRACDRYLVVEVSGSQLRSTSYGMKTSDCYRVPSKVIDFRPSAVSSDTDCSSDKALPAQPVPFPPYPPCQPSC